MNPPRRPYSEELDAIAHASAETIADFIDVRETLTGACVAMFEHYVSDCPGYTGRVAMVVWPGGPELFDVYTFDKNGEAKAQPHESTKTRAAPVLDAARDALAVLEHRHHEGEFADPGNVAAGMLRDALVAHDARPSSSPPAGGSTDPFSPHYRGSDYS